MGTLVPSSGDFSDLFIQDQDPDIDNPDIDSSGNLTYTLKPHAYGQIEVFVSLSDGITTVTSDASADQKTTWAITVLMVNDAPFFDQGGNQHVADNAGPQQVSNWATNIRPGPTGSDAAYDEVGGAYGQTLSFVLSYQAITDADDSTITWQDLFVAGGEPTIDSSGHLTYTPLPGGEGTAVISVVLQDDGETETSAGTTISDPKQDPAAGATAKNFTIIVQPFPEVVSITPAPNATNVPTQLYLELGFSQSMDTGSVLDSTLRITDVTGDDDGDGNLSTSNPNYSFDIQIRAAEVDGLIDLNWNTDRTILKLTSTHRLVPANTYKLDLLTNQAHSHTGTEIAAKGNVPLILGPAPGHSAPKFIVP